MNGLMQPGPTLYAAEELRKKRGSQGLLGAVGEPMSYAPGPVGLLGNALLGAQYLTGEKPMDEGLSGLAMMTGLLQGTKVAPIINNAIRVYHGSPHKFDKPDSSKIGTGEGAQAYGHGLYWAENPEIAKHYARQNSGGVELKQPFEKTRREVVKRIDDRLKYFDSDEFAKAPYDHNAMRDVGNLRLAKASVLDAKDNVQLYGRDAEYFKNIERSGVKLSDLYELREPYLYEGSIRWPDPAREAADPLSAKHFLDWDVPLDRQRPEIKAAVENALNTDFTGEGAKHVRNMGWPESLFETWANENPKWVSEALRKAGIPGITYLDAGSRAAGQGTRNYVTFDDALVELLKRNGGLLGK